MDINYEDIFPSSKKEIGKKDIGIDASELMITELRQYIRQVILEDNASFKKELLQQSGWIEGEGRTEWNTDTIRKGIRPRGRLVKKIWDKHVDREFINSLTFVHWSSEENITQLLLNSINNINKDELACAAYLDEIIAPPKPVGVLIDGYCTLLGNNMEKIYSYGPGMYNVNPSSGLARGPSIADSSTYVIDKEDWKPLFIKNTRNWYSNEAFVDNWKPKAIVHNGKNRSIEIANKIQQIVLNNKGITLPILSPGVIKK